MNDGDIFYNEILLKVVICECKSARFFTADKWVREFKCYSDAHGAV